MPDDDGVSLKDHIAALNLQRDRYEDIIRGLEQRGADNVAAWLKEKSDLHNNLLRAWEKATADDRAMFVRVATFQALEDKFETNTSMTAKALALAEGKSRGYSAVMTAAGFVGGLVVAFAAAYGLFHH